MTKQSIFRKSYTRKFSQLITEVWDTSERELLLDLTEGCGCFYPLFVRHEDGFVDVYYDIENDTDAIVDYYLKNPERFEEVKKRGLADYKKLLKLEGAETAATIAEAFSLFQGFFVAITIAMLIGDEILDDKKLREQRRTQTPE